MTLPRIRVVAWRFPLVSETFVLDHVCGLLGRGYRISVFADRPPDDTVIHRDFTAHGLRERTFHWPPSPVGLRGRAQALARSICTRGGLSNLSVLVPAHGCSWRSAARQFLKAAFMDQCDGGADITHAHFGFVGETLAEMKRCGAVRGKLVVSLHGVDVTPHALRGTTPYPNLFSQADRVLVTTEFMARQARAIGCPADKLLRLPIGISCAEFPFRERRRSPGEPLRLLTIGRLVEKKGAATALRALARIRAAGESAVLSIVGEGPQRASLEQLADRLGTRDAVTFAGALTRDEVVAELDRCDLFLFPSMTAADGDQEGQGLALQEAQACGIPVVATRHGGIPEGCLEGETALLVPENDDAALADAVLALAGRESEWPAMGHAGRKLVETRFTLCSQLDALESLYSTLRAPLAARP